MKIERMKHCVWIIFPRLYLAVRFGMPWRSYAGHPWLRVSVDKFWGRK